jgi:hypothetical protein
MVKSNIYYNGSPQMYNKNTPSGVFHPGALPSLRTDVPAAAECHRDQALRRSDLLAWPRCCGQPFLLFQVTRFPMTMPVKRARATLNPPARWGK